MLTVRGQYYLFSTNKQMFCWKCRSFWERKSFDLKGNRTPNLCFHADCSNQLRYQGWTFAASCFFIQYRFCWCRRFCSKFEIWNVSSARATPFNFDSRTDVLVCRSLWDRKCIDLTGTRTPTIGVMANAETIWPIRTRLLLPHVFNIGSTMATIWVSASAGMA